MKFKSIMGMILLKLKNIFFSTYINTNIMNCPVETHQFLKSWRECDSYSKLSKEYSTNWIINSEKCYFGYIPKEATALIIGTFPVPIKEGSTSDFFYHSEVNLFWKILRVISEKELYSLEDKLCWLSKLKLGITDILYKVQRTDKKCSSSSDSDLNAICFNNISNLLKDNSKINDIFLQV